MLLQEVSLFPPVADPFAYTSILCALSVCSTPGCVHEVCGLENLTTWSWEEARLQKRNHIFYSWLFWLETM